VDYILLMSYTRSHLENMRDFHHRQMKYLSRFIFGGKYTPEGYNDMFNEYFRHANQHWFYHIRNIQEERNNNVQ